MVTINLQQMMTHPKDMDKETLYDLRSLLARFPYFQTARLLYLANLYLLHDASFGKELRKAALFINNRQVLFQMVEGEHYALQKRDSELTEDSDDLSKDRTVSLIDAFLNSVPEEHENESIQLDPSTDYAAYLQNNPSLKEDTQAPMQGQDLIDGFIEKADTGQKLINLEGEIGSDGEISEHLYSGRQQEDGDVEKPIFEMPIPDYQLEDENFGKEDDESYLTETLAKIYIKQGKYSKALEIFKKLSLKNPKKIAYFADQIKHLEELIINTNIKE